MTETLRDAKLFEYLDRIATALERMALEHPEDMRKPIIGIRLDQEMQ